MKKKLLAELLKYSSPKELYIVTWNNLLKLLFCPFKARLKHDIGELREGQIVWVDEVKITMELVTVFVILQRPYYYYHFDIIVDDN